MRNTKPKSVKRSSDDLIVEKQSVLWRLSLASVLTRAIAGDGRRRCPPSSRKPRTYSAEDKAEFFRRLELVRNVSEVAKELGFVRVTCFKWAHQAGIWTGTETRVQRAQFRDRRAGAMNHAKAIQRVEIDKSSALDWDNGVTQIVGECSYSDGRVMRCKVPQILGSVKNSRNTYTRGAPADLARFEAVIEARYLSLIERDTLNS